MRLATVVALIAVFITAGVFAQQDESVGPPKTPVSAEKFSAWAKVKWNAIQQCIVVAKSALTSQSEADQAKSRAMAEAMDQDIDVWNKCLPPAEYRPLYAAFMEMWATTYNLCTFVSCKPSDAGYYFLTEYKRETDRLQSEVVRLSPIIGGLKPLCASWFGPVEPAWERVPIGKWELEEHAEETAGGTTSLVRVRNELVAINSEWQAHLDKGGKPGLAHYGRLLWNLWFEAKMENPMQALPANLQPIRQQEESAVMAVYWAVCRSSQTGEKATPERQEANRQVIGLMAAFLGG